MSLNINIKPGRVVVRDGLMAGKSVLCDDKIRRGVEWSAGSSLTHLTDQSVPDQPANQPAQPGSHSQATYQHSNYQPTKPSQEF